MCRRKGEAPKPLRAYWYLRDEAEEFVNAESGADAATKLGVKALHSLHHDIGERDNAALP